MDLHSQSLEMGEAMCRPQSSPHGTFPSTSMKKKEKRNKPIREPRNYYIIFSFLHFSATSRKPSYLNHTWSFVKDEQNPITQRHPLIQFVYSFFCLHHSNPLAETASPLNGKSRPNHQLLFTDQYCALNVLVHFIFKPFIYSSLLCQILLLHWYPPRLSHCLYGRLELRSWGPRSKFRNFAAMTSQNYTHPQRSPDSPIPPSVIAPWIHVINMPEVQYSLDPTK